MKIQNKMLNNSIKQSTFRGGGNFKGGLIFGFTALSVMILGGLVYATLNSQWHEPSEVNIGETLTASGWNAMGENMKYLKEWNDTASNIMDEMNENIKYLKAQNETLSGQILALNTELNLILPQNAVVAFNLQTCPNGWRQANGAGTIGGSAIPDLRGVFIRGLNSFDNGATSNNRDLDRTNSSKNTTLRDLQNDVIINIVGSSHVMHVQTSGANSGRNGAIYTEELGLSSANVGSATVGTKISFDASKSIGTGHVGTDIRPKNVTLIYCIKE